MPSERAAPFRLATIVVPTDFSEGSRVALDHAVALAKVTKAKIVVLHVIEAIAATMKESLQNVDPYAMAQHLTASPQLLDVYALVRRAIEPAVDQATDTVRTAGVSVSSRVLEGKAYDQITSHAREIGADLIVMGTHGRTGVNHFFMGSVAERVVRTAPCPVMTVRAAPEHPQTPS